MDISIFTQKEKGRALQHIELYQTLYADKLKSDIDKALTDADAKSRSERMSIRRATVLKLFENETDEVLETVQRASDEQKKRLNKEEEARAECLSVNGERTPAEYHQSVTNVHLPVTSSPNTTLTNRSIMALPSKIKPGLQALAEATGWVFFVAAAGPNPAENGSIYMVMYVILLSYFCFF